MIAPTEAGIFRTTHIREDAEKKPMLRYKIDGFTYDVNATVFRGTERIRSNYWLMFQQMFCTQMSELDECQNERLEYEVKMNQFLNGTLADVEEVFERRDAELNDLMRAYIKGLERKIEQVHGIRRNRGIEDVERAQQAIEEGRAENLREQRRHRDRFFDKLYQECKEYSDRQVKPKEVASVEQAKMEPSIKREFMGGSTNTLKVKRRVETEIQIKEVIKDAPPPPPVEPSTPIEITAKAKRRKPKSKPKPKPKPLISVLIRNSVFGAI